MTRPPGIQIRLLDQLDVRRQDGTQVDHDEWRTGKTVDLLRILALSNGRPVRLTTITERLWPDVTPDKARASARTAGSQIRRTLRSNCIVRQGDGILLQGAWVDVPVFIADTRRVRSLSRAGRHRRALDVARAAEGRYRDDFHAHDDESSWARAERASLVDARRSMLSHAADSAVAVADYLSALDFAGLAVSIDPTSEAAHRALMRSYAELGEIGRALHVYESLRTRLIEELGASPSEETRALHLHLLRGDRH